MSSRGEGALPAEVAVLHEDQWTAPFWAAARDERLILPKCLDCGTLRMPPGPFCPGCSSQRMEWVEVSGGGEVFAFTIVRHAMMTVYREHVPYVVALIELDGAPNIRLLGNIVTGEPDSVVTGMRVRTAWDHVSDEVTIVRFVPEDKRREGGRH